VSEATTPLPASPWARLRDLATPLRLGASTRPGRATLAWALAIMAGVCLAVAWTLQTQRNDVLQAQQKQSINLARTLSEQTLRVLTTLDYATIKAEQWAHTPGLQGEALQRLVSETGLGDNILTQISLVDAQGRFVASNLDPQGRQSGRLDLSSRPHVQVHLQDSGSPTGLYIGATLTGKVSGKRTIQISRALRNAAGQLIGILVVSVNPAYFEQLYQGLQLGQLGTIELTGADGRIRARVQGGLPAFEEGLSTDPRLPWPGVLTEAVTTLSHAGHLKTWVGARISDYPLAIWINVDVDEALTDWFKTRRLIWLLAGAFCLAIAVATALMLNSFQRLLQSRAELKQQVRERTQHLSESNAALERKTQALEQTLSQLQTAQSQLVQSEKMASLGQLVANVAHEINTPIGAVKSSGHSIADALSRMLEQLPRVLLDLDEASRPVFLALIAAAHHPAPVMSTREERQITRQLTQQLEALGLSDARHKAELLLQLRAHQTPEAFIALLHRPDCDAILAAAADVATLVSSSDNINTAVERASKIVFALKSYAHSTTGSESRPTDLCQGMDTVLTLYQHQIKQGVELVYQADELPPVNGLPDELNQVWTNLIHNALQAMHQQGSLSIRMSTEGDGVLVSVGDSGPGIPEAIRARIFEPFFTTKPAGEGSGLGLDIVRKIVERHAGRIDFSTEIGVGTTFRVWLPVAGPAAATANP